MAKIKNNIPIKIPDEVLMNKIYQVRGLKVIE
jgi:hypothetical protein